MRRLVFSVLSLTFLAACQPATTELTEEQKAEIEQEVRGLDDDFIAFASNVEAEGFLSLFEQSEDLTFAMYGAVHSSWSTWGGIVKRGFARIGEAEVESCERPLCSHGLRTSAAKVRIRVAGAVREFTPGNSGHIAAKAGQVLRQYGCRLSAEHLYRSDIAERLAPSQGSGPPGLPRQI
jgi:hypothetical protein